MTLGISRVTPVEKIREWHEELTAWRRDFHAHPELGFEEVRTSALVAERLASWGIEVHRGIGKTGVVGVLRNGNGQGRLGIRADMDALPMPEANGFAHKSGIEGKMHGCGHDGHTTMLLATARYLAETRNFDGTVHFIFQPAEEGLGGAQAMLADALFERFPCDTVYGLHNRPGLPVGQFAIRPGPIMAGAIFFDILIQGKGGHGARPEQTIDPVVVGAQIVTALQSVVARNVPALDSAVLSVTGFNAGQAYNVIPDQVTLKGTVRAFKMEMMRLVEERMRAVVQGTAAAFGATAEITFQEIAAPTINAPEEATALGDAAASLVGETAVERNRTPVMGSEDFAYMLLRRPGAYIHVGNGTGDAGGCDVHNPHYDFNDEAIPYGGGVMAALVEQKLARVK